MSVWPNIRATFSIVTSCERERVAKECLRIWKTISLENDYIIEEGKRKWLENSQKRFCCTVCITQEITDCDRCSVTKSLAGLLPNDEVITK